MDCRVSCCTAFTVFVTAFDLWRLRRRFPRRWTEMVGFLPAARAASGFGPYAFSLGGRGRFLLRLRRRGRSCAFLQPAAAGKEGRPVTGPGAPTRSREGGGRCGIHEARPDVCRCYPFQVRAGELVPVRQMLCSRPWPLGGAATATFLAAWAAKTRHFFQHQAFLESWHEDELPRRWGAVPPAIAERRAAFLAFLVERAGAEEKRGKREER
ncbi:MAG: hypothetical protein GX442_08365 [Candidatus Riflebacteria bacterium]|nr:hypothetical protein [Candidatus Riflebacteria bacterium]